MATSGFWRWSTWKLALNVRIQEGALKVSEILQIGIQVADALDDAHSKGIVKREAIRKQGPQSDVALRRGSR